MEYVEPKKDKYIVSQVGAYNNNPNVKNYSNCDISGSFYTVGEASKTPIDISGADLNKSTTKTK
jgi:hypothetical protein